MLLESGSVGLGRGLSARGGEGIRAGERIIGTWGEGIRAGWDTFCHLPNLVKGETVCKSDRPNRVKRRRGGGGALLGSPPTPVRHRAEVATYLT